MVYFLFGKMPSLLWQIFDSIGLIFIAANAQILKNNLTIWSHWKAGTLFNDVKIIGTIRHAIGCPLQDHSLKAFVYLWHLITKRIRRCQGLFNWKIG